MRYFFLNSFAFALLAPPAAANSLDNPSVGSSDAPNVIEVFTSRDCGRCFAFHREILQAYEGSPLEGRVRFVVRDIGSQKTERSDEDVALFCTQVFADWIPSRTALWRAGDSSAVAGTPVERRNFDTCLQNPIVNLVLRFNRSSFTDYGFHGTPAFLVRSADPSVQTMLHGFVTAENFIDTVTGLLE